MKRIAVIGSGTMGAGIAQATALAGYAVVLYDVQDDIVAAAYQAISASIDQGVKRGKTPAEAAEKAKATIELTTDRKSVV